MGVHCTLDVDGTWIAVGCGTILGRYGTYEDYKKDKVHLEKRCYELCEARRTMSDMLFAVEAGQDAFVIFQDKREKVQYERNH